MTAETTELNGQNVTELKDFREQAKQDPSCADRNPRLVAEWLGGDTSRVQYGEVALDVGQPGTMNPMQLLLASFAACDVDVIATHAALLGVEVESLSVEAAGHFNVQSYLGIEGTPGSGYDSISYTVRLRAPGATADQIDQLRVALDRSSPVGDTLARQVTRTLEFQPETR